MDPTGGRAEAAVKGDSMKVLHKGIELRTLRSFVAVVSQRHFGKAADTLHTTQPAISQHVSKLEQLVGHKLLNRKASGIEVTVAGRVLYEHATRMLNMLDSMVRETRAAGDGLPGILRAGISTAAYSSPILQRLKALHQQHPDLEIDIIVEAADSIEPRLRRGEIDIAMTTIAVAEDEFECVELEYLPIGIALPEDHPAARKKRVPLELLASQPLILFPRDKAPQTYDGIIGFCHKHRITPQVSAQAIAFTTVMALVVAGKGLGFVPLSLAKGAPEGITIRPLAIAQPPAFCIYAVWPRQMSSGAARAVKTLMQK